MAYFLITDSITTALLILLVVTFIYYLYRARKNNIFHRLRVPGPERIPVLGEMFHVIRKHMTTHDTDLVRQYGKVVGIYEGTAPALLVTDLDLVRNVLIKDSHVFINRRSMEGIGGPLEHALIALKDEEWKNARSIVSPTFSSAKLKAMYTLMNEVGDTYRDRLLEYADKQEIFNINELNGQYALDSISSCLFGIETNSLKNENATLIKHLKKFFTVDFKNIFLYIFLISPRLARYLGGKGYSIFPSDAINYVSNIVNHVISQRRQHLERRNDFIQMMIDHEEAVKDEEGMTEQTETKDPRQQWGTLKKTLNDKEIFSQGLLFLTAGFETTSALLSFFFYFMTIEPVVQEKVYEEIKQELGNDEITYEKLNRLQYLEMAINETLRMYPPFIRLNRVASYDYQLGDYHVPKGSSINVPVYQIHHDPEYWSEPEKFIPERFSPAEKVKRHPMTFLPFGDGPRNCIGMRFALLEAKLAIAKSLRDVELQKCEKTEVPLQLGKVNTLKAKNGVWVRAVRRSE
ncbi:unnamed protein product [Rotaria magnacalcarata]|nr:unnamed protein product [Rotaria magnacalcarata]CAF1472437.1 unnamed protein product [Rotaria magnacalcarata]CAF2095982.1 unnamed protein product [Rotaria magnacalcarata]CAF2156106.1 unnamed protein product [Rotaria magnacalcarata]CAF3969411.1 unnamed protein product [Rotaria magnacalcarata]